MPSSTSKSFVSITDQLSNKNILITGANGGIGRAVSQKLLEHQPKSLTLACRTQAKSDSCKEQLVPYASSTDLYSVGGFEMLDPKVLKQAIYSLEIKLIDVVFIQVGGVFFQSKYEFISTETGQIEKTVFQNAIGGYLLVQYLLERRLLSKNARIVFMGGEGSRGVKPIIDKPVFQTMEALKTYLETGPSHKYQTMNAIGVSKLVSALISLKLAELDNERGFLWFSPGLTGGTQGLDHKPGVGKYLSKYVMFPIVQALGFAQSPEAAADKCIKSLNGELGGNGSLLGAPENKALGPLCDQKPMNPDFTNQHLRDQLFIYLQKHFGTFPIGS